mmetsp:Transcript_14979/g.37717  ORF Transcript_14979/g.37717 Transcript_14979/m.37717 type:complete len:233 (+) Transcript_14979:720-1418(+)
MIKRVVVVRVLFTIVFFPWKYQYQRQGSKSNRSLERTDVSKVILQDLGNNTGQNSHCSVSDRLIRIGFRHPFLGEASLSVFSRHPRLKCRKQQIRRDSTKNSTKQKNTKVVGMLESVDDNLQNAVHDARVFSAEFVNETTQKWSKNSTTQETSDEKGRNIHVIGQVQCVHVCPLHPIGQHDHQVYEDVLSTEAIELCFQIGFGFLVARFFFGPLCSFTIRCDKVLRNNSSDR